MLDAVSKKEQQRHDDRVNISVTMTACEMSVGDSDVTATTIFIIYVDYRLQKEMWMEQSLDVVKIYSKFGEEEQAHTEYELVQWIRNTSYFRVRDSTEALGTSDHDSIDSVHTESVQYRRTDSGILYEHSRSLVLFSRCKKVGSGHGERSLCCKVGNL